jgi:hypothetical protein
MMDQHERVSIVILYTCFVLLCIVGYLLLGQIR